MANPPIQLKVYYFARDTLKYMADITEPKQYPDLFEPLVTLEEYIELQAETNRIKIERDKTAKSLRLYKNRYERLFKK